MHINQHQTFRHSTEIQLADGVSDALVNLLSLPTISRSSAGTHWAGERAALAKQHYDLRRRRDHFLAPGLFGEPAWDILLTLYWTQKAQMRMTVTNVIYLAAVPATTAHRYIDNLCRAGILAKKKHPTDGRVSWLTIADAVVEKMDAYFDWMLSAGKH